MSRDIDWHRPSDRCSKDRRSVVRSSLVPTLRRTIERSAVTWYLGSLCVAFLGGFSTYHYIQQASGIEAVSKIEQERLVSTVADLRDTLGKVIAQRDLVLEELAKKKQGGADGVTCPGRLEGERARGQK